MTPADPIADFDWRIPSGFRPRLPENSYPVPLRSGGVQYRSAPSLERCALGWFRAGFDTHHAALALGRPEVDVADALARARDAIHGGLPL